MSIFDDNVLDESISHVEESDNTLLIFMLSYFQPKIKLRPLRRLLTRHKIVFSLQDGLSCLRRKLKTVIRTLKREVPPLNSYYPALITLQVVTYIR